VIEPKRVTEYWMSVDRRGPDDCWPWTGYINEDGYGEFFVEGRMVGAHELAVTFSTGERRLPQLDTCHSCNNPPCCNPAHVRFDTRDSNIADKVRAGNHVRVPNEVVRLIRERYAAGAAQSDVATAYGVSQAFVCNVVNGRTRREAGGPIKTVRSYHRRSA
jgi:hypothetical protein